MWFWEVVRLFAWFCLFNGNSCRECYEQAGPSWVFWTTVLLDLAPLCAELRSLTQSGCTKNADACSLNSSGTCVWGLLLHSPEQRLVTSQLSLNSSGRQALGKDTSSFSCSCPGRTPLPCSILLFVKECTLSYNIYVPLGIFVITESLITQPDVRLLVRK